MSPSIDLVEDLTLLAPEVPHAGPSWWWALPVVIVLGVVVLLIIRRRRGRPAFVTPPDKVALSQLETLFASLDVLDARDFALQVSRILRSYIEDRFGLHAPRHSTEEFLAEARVSPLLSPEQQAWVSAFLVHCDQAKFALAHLESTTKHALHEEVVRFVRTTTPPPA
ncbi:MAG TPA: hypothetical protein VIO38_12100 [Rariglobus sp.]